MDKFEREMSDRISQGLFAPAQGTPAVPVAPNRRDDPTERGWEPTGDPHVWRRTSSEGFRQTWYSRQQEEPGVGEDQDAPGHRPGPPVNSIPERHSTMLLDAQIGSHERGSKRSRTI